MKKQLPIEEENEQNYVELVLFSNGNWKPLLHLVSTLPTMIGNNDIRGSVKRMSHSWDGLTHIDVEVEEALLGHLIVSLANLAFIERVEEEVVCEEGADVAKKRLNLIPVEKHALTYEFASEVSDDFHSGLICV